MDVQELINEARKAQAAVYLAAPEMAADDLSRIIRGLADALEALNRENQELTEDGHFEWAIRSDGIVVPKYSEETAREAAKSRRFGYRAVKRLVGPWVEVSS